MSKAARTDGDAKDHKGTASDTAPSSNASSSVESAPKSVVKVVSQLGSNLPTDQAAAEIAKCNDEKEVIFSWDPTLRHGNDSKRQQIILALLNLITTTKTLQALDLSCNNLKSDDLPLFAEALTKNESIGTVVFKGNMFCLASLKLLAESLEKRKIKTTVNMELAFPSDDITAKAQTLVSTYKQSVFNFAAVAVRPYCDHHNCKDHHSAAADEVPASIQPLMVGGLF